MSKKEQKKLAKKLIFNKNFRVKKKKNKNLFSFNPLKIKDIFIPSMKLSLNYHQQNFIRTFFKKMTVKNLFE